MFKIKKTLQHENRTFFMWVDSFIPYLYAIGITLIIGWMMISSVLLGFKTYNEDPFSFFLLSENTQLYENTNEEPLKIDSETQIQVNVTSSSKNSPWYSFLNSIIESDLYGIIFRGIFLLMIWIFVFLVIPIGFRRLKRIKLFRMEIEVENVEKAAIQTIEITGGKAKLMAYLSSKDAEATTLEFLNDETSTPSIDFHEVLEHFLMEIKEGYQKQFDAHFVYEIVLEDFPDKFNLLIQESKETEKVMIRNKINNENLFRKNYLLMYYSFHEQEMVTILSSYTYEFDVLDKHLIELLHHNISKNIENIEYMVALTDPPSES
ncbi:hypothetical protein [Chengkuizengella axinellae]|uniref:Uncharacterized protein n=1 Tax=Chengkuizengella axinellae TaxID=3064388 RepID=A0ABT9J5Z4_9BACL|nr:hypothetical protein [Chengkuizengella sp. 2205SS18-9]MDP5277043.1 hypothetical protein [Chengkuizengella sp. 2205SS18-9]